MLRWTTHNPSGKLGAVEDLEDQLRRWQVVGEVLEQARLRRNPKLSKRRVAALAGLSEGHYRQMAAGRSRRNGIDLPPPVSPEALESVARVLGVDPDVLFADLGWESKARDKSSGGRLTAAEELATIKAELVTVVTQLDDVRRRARLLLGDTAPPEELP
jgi:transcriptional regulator with XRE-family HTH domain